MLSGLYFKHSGEILREDYYMYYVYTYLVLIRLPDLTWAGFQRLVALQEKQKMLVFLSFLLNENSLNNWLKDEVPCCLDVSAHADGERRGARADPKGTLGAGLAETPPTPSSRLDPAARRAPKSCQK